MTQKFLPPRLGMSFEGAELDGGIVAESRLADCQPSLIEYLLKDAVRACFLPRKARLVYLVVKHRNQQQQAKRSLTIVCS